MCGCVRASVINRHNCVWRSVCAFIFMKCYFRHLICHSLVNVQRSVSVDVLLSPPSPPLSVSQHSFSANLTHSPLVDTSSPSPAPTPPVLAPLAGANHKASSLEPYFELEMPCLAEEHLSWICSIERSSTPSGYVKGVLEDREGGDVRVSK